jgi:hypothetical protein
MSKVFGCKLRCCGSLIKKIDYNTLTTNLFQAFVGFRYNYCEDISWMIISHLLSKRQFNFGEIVCVMLGLHIQIICANLSEQDNCVCKRC